MRLFSRATWAAALAWLLLAPAAHAQGEPASAPSHPVRVCVFDILGTAGESYNEAKDYALAMKKETGVDMVLKTYTDERVAIEDFRTGQCDGVTATALRTRQFNPIAGALDSIGSSIIVRDGKVDMKASYEVVHDTIRTFASPAAAKLMTNGDYEIAGIIPLGACYPFVNDRKIDSVEAAAGKRIAAFAHDKAQAIMIQRIGAQPVDVDVTTFATKFNNGMVDIVVAPALVYRPLELYKGLGTKGGIVRLPMIILTYQMVIRQDKFPPGFGEKSRIYWLDGFDRALKAINKAEADIPADKWMTLTPKDTTRYALMMRDARIDIANRGLYNKVGLKVLKRVRCHINPTDPECSSNSEMDVN